MTRIYSERDFRIIFASSEVIVTMESDSRVIQVTNIAPQATKDQMVTLFSFLGKIEDLRLYPTMRDASINIQSRVCFIKFQVKL